MEKCIKLDPDGTVIAVSTYPPGTELLDMGCDGYTIKDDYLYINKDFAMWHECDPNTAVLCGRLVAIKYIEAGAPICVNLNMLRYKLEETFECACGSPRCVESVEGFGAIPYAEKVRLLQFADVEVRREAYDWGFVPPASGPIELSDDRGEGLEAVATRNLAKGTTVCQVTGIVLSFPTEDTIQVGFGKHLLFNGCAQFVNHLCDPNVRVVVHENGEGFDITALRDIPTGEVLGINYLATEWDLSENFECRCGAAFCFKKIRGYVHLSERKQQRMFHLVSPVIREAMALVVPG